MPALAIIEALNMLEDLSLREQAESPDAGRAAGIDYFISASLGKLLHGRHSIFRTLAKKINYL